MRLPGNLGGWTPGSAWLTRLKEFAQSLLILPGPGYRVKRGPGGTILEFEPGIGGRAQGPGPLSHAVYVPAYTLDEDRTGGSGPTGGGAQPARIYGCRAGLLFEMDSGGRSTGRSLNFAEGFGPADSYLAWDKDAKKLWASHWADFSTGERVEESGLYRFDLARFAVDEFFPWSHLGVDFTEYRTSNGDLVVGVQEWLVGGPRRIWIHKGKIIGTGQDGFLGYQSLVVFVQGADGQESLEIFWAGMNLDEGAVGWNPLWVDEERNEIWVGNDVGLTKVFRDPPDTGNWDTGLGWSFWNAYGFSDLGGGGSTQSKPEGGLYGADYCPDSELIYCVCLARDGTPENFGKCQIATVPRNTPVIPGSDPFRFTKFDLVYADGVEEPDVEPKPRNIRWFAKTGKFYLPAMKANVVLELDPTVNKITKVLKGFDRPWDILPAGDKAFAVQLGNAGLKQLAV
jgi:hypothetical protein